MTRILAIDPSTKTGLACFDGDTLVGTRHLKFSGSAGFERLQLIAKGIETCLLEWDPSVAFIEGYAYGNKHTLVPLVECGTVIRRELYARSVPWVEVSPSSLKKFTTGRGNATKPHMAASVLDRWGFASKSDDIIDAYALGRYGVDSLKTIKIKPESNHG